MLATIALFTTLGVEQADSDCCALRLGKLLGQLLLLLLEAFLLLPCSTLDLCSYSAFNSHHDQAIA
jgi:hypothetical protein